METTITSKFHRAAFQFKSAEAIAQERYEIIATAEHQLAEWSVATSLAKDLEN
ncbi:MAG: hypothetical protein KA465_00465 [Anaerolineaceae bacterium]|jgi:hypothetical protein|nr:hypothetical protein [Anaerolineaceae bacterium]